MKRTIVLIFNLWVTFNVSAQNDIEEGQKLFKANCSSCHAIDKKLVGPALKGVSGRRENRWIIDFVHSSQIMVKNGDAQAVALFEEYNKTVMPDHKNLSNVQINSILAYIKDQESKISVERGIVYTIPYLKPYKFKNSFLEKVVYLNLDEPQKPVRREDYLSWFLIASFVLMLIVLLNILVYYNALKKSLYERIKEAINKRS